MECKRCGSSHIIRYGTRNGKQVWKCKNCGKYYTYGKPLKKKEISLVFNYSLGYVIGVLVGDGSLSKWKDYHYFDHKHRQVPKSQATKIVPRYKYGFQLQAKDKEFVETFARHLEEVSGRKVKPYPIKSREMKEMAGHKLSKPYTFHGFKAQLIHKKLYQKINPLTENLTWIKEANLEVRKGFLRGLFDSDGGVSKRPRVHLTNQKISLLQLTKELLEQLGIKSRISPLGTLFRLWIDSKENNRKFFNIIGFSIKRKQKNKGKLG